MFVKMVRSEVEKNNGHVEKIHRCITNVFDCDVYRLVPETMCMDGCVPEVSLILEKLGTGDVKWDVTIKIPEESPSEVVDIYIMNSDGKTVDRHTF